jgi:hypothetical protein
VTVRFSIASEDTVNVSKEALSVTSRSPSITAAAAVPALQVRSTVSAAISPLVSKSKAVAFAPVSVTVSKSPLLSTVIPPATSAEIVKVLRFALVPIFTEVASPAIVTDSRSPRLSKSIAGPYEGAAVVASGSATPVTSTVSILAVVVTVKETREFEVKDSTSPFI